MESESVSGLLVQWNS
ncbi:hypothetical protein EYZ11_009061 [Aspergillus tanneri]|uniref:Uncharacterized protein n=1 Tax=Aspergillus tanneri TaxID=1220188 RepID=A0A4S3JB17_9EURO|nr:hypothetical protein EYZ11_009061 [Aspergillus tanneri]